MSKISSCQAFLGTVIYCDQAGNFFIRPDCSTVVCDGKIEFFGKLSKREILDRYNIGTDEILVLKNSQFLIPGFVDTHLHAPQYGFCGITTETTLLDWLNTYTFPIESKYEDIQYARIVYPNVVKSLLRHGTTTASYFSTIHLESTKLLCDIIETCGQRAFVGKVTMVTNSPDYLVENEVDAIENLTKFIEYTNDKKNELLSPVVTPRFLPSINTKVAHELADIAKAHDIHIQSHVSENLSECAWVSELFSDSSSYVEAFDKLGLLGKKTYLAHGIHLSDDEINILHETKTSISHCANSNFSLSSGVCDVRKLLDSGVNVGLGTDVAGGFSPSVMDAIRVTTLASNTQRFLQGSGYKQITYKEAFYLATLGGAKVLGLEDKIGNFEVGKDFDAIVVDVSSENSNVHLAPDDDVAEMFQKFLFVGDDRNMIGVYVKGEEVKQGLMKVT